MVDIISTHVETRYGVPQVIILGPFLSLSYLNNLFIQNTIYKIISFADDTVMYYTCNTWYNFKLGIKNDLKELKDWFNSRLLLINFEKTVYISNRKYLHQNTVLILKTTFQ